MLLSLLPISRSLLLAQAQSHSSIWILHLLSLVRVLQRLRLARQRGVSQEQDLIKAPRICSGAVERGPGTWFTSKQLQSLSCPAPLPSLPPPKHKHKSFPSTLIPPCGPSSLYPAYPFYAHTFPLLPHPHHVLFCTLPLSSGSFSQVKHAGVS